MNEAERIVEKDKELEKSIVEMIRHYDEHDPSEFLTYMRRLYHPDEEFVIPADVQLAPFVLPDVILEDNDETETEGCLPMRSSPKLKK